MNVIDPGHRYKLASLDGELNQTLTFVKRCDLANPHRFPGNKDAYPGTTLQNVLRACLERFRYLQNQIWCPENVVCILAIRVTIWLLENRAARRHGRSYWHGLGYAERAPMCSECGHTDCNHEKGKV